MTDWQQMLIERQDKHIKLLSEALDRAEGLAKVHKENYSHVWKDNCDFVEELEQAYKLMREAHAWLLHGRLVSITDESVKLAQRIEQHLIENTGLGPTDGIS